MASPDGFAEQNSWMSVMGLLDWNEFFVTVDHGAIWRRHIAWAKHDGGELRNHMTQRFASNMVFMSLLLGAELNILFNSSKITTEMRQCMMTQQYDRIFFWIGVVIIASVLLTIFTLVSTFTAWGMVSSISDSNAHCILRSSLGQYVTQLPSRLIVTALYSFLLWVVMWLFVLLPGILSKVLLLCGVVMFFHIVIVFSAFGKIILHTGAMGSERILDEELEQRLLPSGLHTGLLIMAMAQQRAQKTVVEQYTPLPDKSKEIQVETSTESRKPVRRHRRDISFDNASVLSNESFIIKQNARVFFGEGAPGRSRLPSVESSASSAEHVIANSGTSKGSGQLLPRASVLNKPNRTLSSVLRVVDRSLSNTELDIDSNATDVLQHSGRPDNEARVSRRSAGVRRRSTRINREWLHENEARFLYNAPPPPPPPEEDYGDQEAEGAKGQNSRGPRLPRPSLLNRANHTFKSIRRLAQGDEVGSNSTNPGSSLNNPLRRITERSLEVLSHSPEFNANEDPELGEVGSLKSDSGRTTPNFISLSPDDQPPSPLQHEEEQHLLGDANFQSYSTEGKVARKSSVKWSDKSPSVVEKEEQSTVTTDDKGHGHVELGRHLGSPSLSAVTTYQQEPPSSSSRIEETPHIPVPSIALGDASSPKRGIEPTAPQNDTSNVGNDQGKVVKHSMLGGDAYTPDNSKEDATADVAEMTAIGSTTTNGSTRQPRKKISFRSGDATTKKDSRENFLKNVKRSAETATDYLLETIQAKNPQKEFKQANCNDQKI